MSLEQWYPFIKLPISFEQWEQLPQNPAYKYEYIGGEAWLTARPKGYHCVLDLESRHPPESVRGFHDEIATFRPIREDDWENLPYLFAPAFCRVPPISQLSRDDARKAALGCLERTRTGGDGPLVPGACFIARCDADPSESDVGERLVGAALVTLTPKRDLESFDADWDAEVPPDPIEQRWGWPHLTWIFTGYWSSRYGIGTALLDHVVNALLELGYRELVSTFVLGNESSTLWHWKNGFRLLSWPGSQRAIERAVEKRIADNES